MTSLSLEESLAKTLELRLEFIADLNDHLAEAGLADGIEEAEELPGPASEESIAAVEAKLGVKLGPVGDLLRLVNGIPEWLAYYKIFGTDFYLSDKYEEAVALFEIFREGSAFSGKDTWPYPEPSECLLFGHCPESYDLFFCYVKDGVATGPFVWASIDDKVWANIEGFLADGMSDES